MSIASACLVSPARKLFIVINADRIDAVRAVFFIRADVPFAKVTGAIAGLMQQISNRRALSEATVSRIFTKRRRELARHQTGAGRAASNAGRIELRKPSAFAGQPVDIWRASVGMTVAAQISVAQIVHQDQHDVGPVDSESSLTRWHGGTENGTKTGEQ